MAKEKFERTKPHVNIGTIGHVDHGVVPVSQLAIATLIPEVFAYGSMFAAILNHAYKDIYEFRPRSGKTGTD